MENEKSLDCTRDKMATKGKNVNRNILPLHLFLFLWFLIWGLQHFLSTIQGHLPLVSDKTQITHSYCAGEAFDKKVARASTNLYLNRR